jgi:starch-binding outer membrane protein, SusD/RagB family
MTTTLARASRRSLAVAALLAGTAGCSDFLNVENPNVIDVNAIDPIQDAATLANSAQQNFAASYGWLIMYSSWFTGETLVAETFPTRNEFGRRDVAESNTSLNGDVWTPLSLAAASTKIVLDLDLPTPDKNINRERTFLWRGYSFVFMAENFCTGAVDSGAELTTAAMLDSAVANFTSAITIGNAIASTDSKTLANVALVGRARAHLQAGRKSEAAADAANVPAGFNYAIPFVDDLANRTRLSNRLWQFTLDRGSMSVAEPWRNGDPRVPFKAPGEHNLSPQDASSGPFYIQSKYPAYATPVRLASKLEADYIAAEAGTPAAQLALIAARRSANGRPAYAGGTDAASVLTELMTQKGFDFWLEGKRIGDFRRNPANVAFMPVPGAAYFKPGFPAIGNKTCYPIPLAEKDNNPNF